PTGKVCHQAIRGLDVPCEFCPTGTTEHLREGVRREASSERSGRWYRGVGRVIRWPDGRDVWLKRAVDITEEKHAEEQVRWEARMQALRTLAGGIAHEFNNLMMGVLGNAALLKARSPARGEERRMVEDIRRCAQRTAEITRKMLAYARLGRFETRRIDLNEIVRKALGELAESRVTEARIEEVPAGDLDPVEGDGAQLLELVAGLLLNAAEAVAEGGRITVTTRNEVVPERRGPVPPGRYVCIIVEDNGCGMDAETLARAFEPFFTTKFQGRGMGLAAAYGIVKSHGGYITAQSEQGKGSVFRVYLPAEGRAEKCSKERAERTEGTILVIESDGVVREVTRRVLAGAGCRVAEAGSVKEAMEALRGRDGEMDAAIIDSEAPGVRDREELAKLFDREPHMKGILTSTFDLEEIWGNELGERSGGFLRKPFSAEELVAAVHKALAGSRGVQGCPN
ncbi:MAG: ATP-binding protein, partial [Planctomycetota bacterium]